jgi:Mn-dependent DtxR family transcriptional regulator
MTDKQEIVIEMLRTQETVTTAEFNARLKRFYYHNHEHYVSEILTRMVKSGKIERIRTGVYRLRSKGLGSPSKQIPLL